MSETTETRINELKTGRPTGGWLLPAPLVADYQLARCQVLKWTVAQVEALAAFVDDPEVDEGRKTRARRDLDVARSATPTLQRLHWETAQRVYRSRL